MSSPPPTEPCPYCKEPVSLSAECCPHCGEELFDEGPSRPSPPPVEPTDFLIPTNVSGWSILSCYLGLIGFCFPFLGLVLSIPAVIFGIVALRKRKRQATYGAVTSDIRAIIGLVLGTLGTLIWAGLIIALVIGAAMDRR